MIIAAVSDLDTLGSNIERFWSLLQDLKKPDLFLFVGDMYQYKNVEQYNTILSFLKKLKFSMPIIAVFGNREFEQEQDKIKTICKNKIKFLDDESIELKIKGKIVGIVGSRGSLDQPTFWQSRYVQGIRDVYLERIEKIRKLLESLKSDVKVLLTHYSPTYKTLKGENPPAYPGLGSKKLEKILVETKITFAMHGHAHYGIPLAFVDSIPVFNVALSVNKKIVEINTDKLPKLGLMKFVD